MGSGGGATAQSRAIEMYLAYGELGNRYPASLPVCAWRADRHWLALSARLFASGDAARDEAARAAVHGRAFASVTRLTWRGLRNHVYSEYPTTDFAKQVAPKARRRQRRDPHTPVAPPPGTPSPPLTRHARRRCASHQCNARYSTPRVRA